MVCLYFPGPLVALPVFPKISGDYMFGLGPSEMMIILVLVLVVFGAGKLPEIGSSLGKGLKSFTKAVRERDEIDITPKDENQNDDKK
jgi:sec-independent protein translocase protein TatA